MYPWPWFRRLGKQTPRRRVFFFTHSGQEYVWAPSLNDKDYHWYLRLFMQHPSFVGVLPLDLWAYFGNESEAE